MTPAGPTFLRPPVAEVVCGIQFQDLANWTTAQFGRFWAELASEYPETEDQSPLPKLLLDSSVQRSEIQVLEFPPLRRVFFKAIDGKYLIQLQPNRFLHNWRKASEGDEYPRFASVYERFEAAWMKFLLFLTEHGFDQPDLQFWELTYVNHITAPEAVFPRDVWNFLSFYQNSPSAITAEDAVGKSLEASNMLLHFDWRLPDEVGILSLDVKHGARLPDQKQVLVFELTCRGKIPSQELDLRNRFGVGHDAIVNSFAKLTTKQGHKIWGRTE